MKAVYTLFGVALSLFAAISFGGYVNTGFFSANAKSAVSYPVQTGWMEKQVCGSLLSKYESLRMATHQDYEWKLNNSLQDLKDVRYELEQVSKRLFEAQTTLQEKQQHFAVDEVERTVEGQNEVSQLEEDTKKEKPASEKVRSAKEKIEIFAKVMMTGLTILLCGLLGFAWLVLNNSTEMNARRHTKPKRSSEHPYKPPFESNTISSLLQCIIAEMTALDNARTEGWKSPRLQELEQRVSQMIRRTPEVIFNLQGEFTARDVKKACHKASLVFHPDKWMAHPKKDQNFATRVFVSAVQARDILLARLEVDS